MVFVSATLFKVQNYLNDLPKNVMLINTETIFQFLDLRMSLSFISIEKASL